MRLLRRSDHRRMPWKNGMGLTEEVLIHPENADLAGFGWRISIAHVGADGPFSLFPGIDRSILLLEGRGLHLDFAEESVELSADGPPHAFSGDVAVSSRNAGGPTTDLNIMTRRDSHSHSVARATLAGIEDPQPSTLLFFTDACEIASGEAALQIGRFDTLVIEDGDRPFGFAKPAPLVSIRIFPAGR